MNLFYFILQSFVLYGKGLPMLVNFLVFWSFVWFWSKLYHLISCASMLHIVKLQNTFFHVPSPSHITIFPLNPTSSIFPLPHGYLVERCFCHSLQHLPFQMLQGTNLSTVTFYVFLLSRLSTLAWMI